MVFKARRGLKSLVSRFLPGLKTLGFPHPVLSYEAIWKKELFSKLTSRSALSHHAIIT